MNRITREQAMQYEIRARNWTGKIEAAWLQALAGRFFAWLVRRKYSAYVKSLEIEQRRRWHNSKK